MGDSYYTKNKEKILSQSRSLYQWHKINGDKKLKRGPKMDANIEGMFPIPDGATEKAKLSVYNRRARYRRKLKENNINDNAVQSKEGEKCE